MTTEYIEFLGGVVESRVCGVQSLQSNTYTTSTAYGVSTWAQSSIRQPDYWQQQNRGLSDFLHIRLICSTVIVRRVYCTNKVPLYDVATSTTERCTVHCFVLLRLEAISVLFGLYQSWKKEEAILFQEEGLLLPKKGLLLPSSSFLCCSELQASHYFASACSRMNWTNPPLLQSAVRSTTTYYSTRVLLQKEYNIPGDPIRSKNFYYYILLRTYVLLIETHGTMYVRQSTVTRVLYYCKIRQGQK